MSGDRRAYELLLAYGELAEKAAEMGVLPTNIGVPTIHLRDGMQYAKSEISKYRDSYETERKLTQAYEANIATLREMIGQLGSGQTVDRLLAVLDE